jgi:hypothetical protein
MTRSTFQMQVGLSEAVRELSLDPPFVRLPRQEGRGPSYLGDTPQTTWETDEAEKTGKSYVAAYESMEKFFLSNRSSDGFPILPPTREAVEEMLKGTKRFGESWQFGNQLSSDSSG